LDYVTQPNTLILAVSAANADIATSDGIQLAHRVDREGVRTLGVLTKIDIMDEGTDAADILEGRVIPLRRGFIGVMNMSQRDLDLGKNVGEHRNAEREFFATHPKYRHMAERCGTAYLAETLSSMLLQHIQSTLPTLRGKIEDLLKSTKAELAKYDEGSPSLLHAGSTQNAAQLLHLLTAYANAVSESISGRSEDSSKARELYGGARINFIFHERFVPYIASLSPSKDLTDEQIRMAISNSQGNRTALFPSEPAFETLLVAQLARLKKPSLRCVGFVFEELVRIADQCAHKLERYPLLRRRVFEVTVELLNLHRPMAEEHLTVNLMAERLYINSNHPDFGDSSAILQAAYGVSGAHAPSEIQHAAPPASAQLRTRATTTAVNPNVGNQNVAPSTSSMFPPAPVMEGKPTIERVPFPAHGFDTIPDQITHTGPLSEREGREHFALRSLIESYFRVVKKTVQDQTPKIVTYFLVKRLTERLRNFLVEKLYKEGLLEALLQENEEVVRRRSAAQRMLACLNAAKEVLDSVNDGSFAAAYRGN